MVRTYMLYIPTLYVQPTAIDRRTACCRAKWLRRGHTSSCSPEAGSTATSGRARHPWTTLQSLLMSQRAITQRQQTPSGQLRILRACTAGMLQGMLSTAATRARRGNLRGPRQRTQALRTHERAEFMVAARILQLL